MKILIASLFFPRFSATHAGSRFVAELIKDLSKFHEIYLACRIEESEREDIDRLRPFCKELFVFPYHIVSRRGLLTSVRLITSYFLFGLEVNKIVKSLPFDLIQVEWVEAGIFLAKTDVPMVLDAHDVITKPAERAVSNSKGLMRLIHWLLYRVVRFIELKTIGKFDVIITRADYDKHYLRTMTKSAVIDVVPHPAGLDISDKRYEQRKNSILFFASYKHRPTNVDAALFFYHDIYPRVRERIPDARFIIAGYGPPDQLLDIARKDRSVLVTGFIDDIDKCYKQAAVFVAPTLVGGGIIVKILDAMAAGVPVVTTTYGNEGIGAKPGVDLVIGDTAEAFAEGVINVLSDHRFAEKLAMAGRNYIEQHYGEKVVFDKFRAIIEELNLKKG